MNGGAGRPWAPVSKYQKRPVRDAIHGFSGFCTPAIFADLFAKPAMDKRFPQYDELDLPKVAADILAIWDAEDTFGKSLELRKDASPFVFYEGPPSANGLPGIHHVMARAIKDIFCRYQTQKGHRVDRKAGWDTHGLPIELGVEKELGITKEDIGKKISIEDYNAACKKAVMRYTHVWNDMTRRIGFWLDLEKPYVTYHTKYIESVWFLLKKLYDDQLLYKGYTIQPYSPAAGTGLSSHELNQPGTYKPVKDTSVVAMFKVNKDPASEFLFKDALGDVFILAWTTTPWTLPSNCALAVGPSLEYACVRTFNPYTHEPQTVVVAKNRLVETLRLKGSEGAVQPLEKWVIEECLHGRSNVLGPSGRQFDGIVEMNGVEAFVEVELGRIAVSTPERILSGAGDKPVILVGLRTELAALHVPWLGSSMQRIQAMAFEDFVDALPSFYGHQLEGVRYEPLLPNLPIVKTYAENNPDSFRVIGGDFVTTEDGTGVVHVSPTFGADDKRVADQHGIPGMYRTAMSAEEGSPSLKFTIEQNDFAPEREGLVIEKAILPIVDRQGRYIPEMGEFAGEYVKAEYLSAEQQAAEAKRQGRDKYLSVDERIAIKLKTEGRAFKVEKYEHNYPHCWRTDKPILYYPLDSWFVKVTAKKQELIDNNKKIKWKPESTGTGRFGNWLENLQDWNLSRSRYWGIPLPIWRSEDDSEEPKCIGSLRELKEEIARAVKAGVMKTDPYSAFNPDDLSDANYEGIDLHRPFVDDIVLVSPGGKPMKRETDLIDVWFDSGAMPYAQWHYPFSAESRERIKKTPFTDGTGRKWEQYASPSSLSGGSKISFPAHFIAEGVDQTRGWFYTLHAIATLVFDSRAYDTVVSNGLVLDKMGQKMSKRLGNAVDPFKTLDAFGADAVRWYMISNASPWDNLKFDAEGITEVQRKFFRALFNTYNFFALYANIDAFDGQGDVALTESDRWILSRLNSVTKLADASFADYEPTVAARAIQDFVVEDLSNWYVRLNRRRFWKGGMGADKNAAFRTLHHCLEVVSMLSAPISPFFSDRLYRDLSGGSVHLTKWPTHDEAAIDVELERSTAYAQRITSLVLGIRKKEKIKVRQPLQRLIIPVRLGELYHQRLLMVRELILSEVNVKSLEFVDETKSGFTKRIKPDFKKLGARLGKQMKAVANAVGQLEQPEIAMLESSGKLNLRVDGGEVDLLLEDVEITTENVPGLSVASDGPYTVALDITLSGPLLQEGIARELVSRIQTLRKESGFAVTDRIDLHIQRNGDVAFEQAVSAHAAHILAETLSITPLDQLLVTDLPQTGSTVHGVALDERSACVLSLSRSSN